MIKPWVYWLYRVQATALAAVFAADKQWLALALTVLLFGFTEWLRRIGGKCK